MKIPPSPAIVCLALLAACSSGGGPEVLTGGSASIPDCTDPPEIDMTGTWTMSGTVTVTSPGCDEADVNDAFTACGLLWEVTQEGNELTIVSDSEYEIRGRICGKEVFLRNGLWLGLDGCSDEDGVEVVIDASALSWNGSSVSGTLTIRENCTATFAVDLFPAPVPAVVDNPEPGRVLLAADRWIDAGIVLRHAARGDAHWIPAASLRGEVPTEVVLAPGTYEVHEAAGVADRAAGESRLLLEVRSGREHLLPLTQVPAR